MISTRRFLSAVLVAAASTAVLTAPAHASADVVVHELAVSDTDRQAVLDHWTPERIAAMETGPSDPDTPPAPDAPDGAGVPKGTAVERTVGRLFFVDRDGEDSSCTATVVTSENRSTIVTGAHCVFSADLLGNDPKWFTKLLFVPGFHDNERPFGSYVARAAVVSQTYVDDSEREDHDQAFLVLGRGTKGGLAQDTVGASQSLGVDVPGERPAREFGYPRASDVPGLQVRPEFKGMRLAQCWGDPLENQGGADVEIRPGQWGVACEMGGGSSGGPRLSSFDESTGLGTVVGVNTQGWRLDETGTVCRTDDSGCVRHLVGPQFTSAITGPLFERAQSA